MMIIRGLVGGCRVFVMHYGPHRTCAITTVTTITITITTTTTTIIIIIIISVFVIHFVHACRCM